MIDCNFPHIIYDKALGPQLWGHHHGESFKEAIRELANIRKDLMLDKSPHLRETWKTLAREQAQFTKLHLPKCFEEIEGISSGSNVPLEEIILLNNYTDFRDIKSQDEGCTTIGLNRTSRVCGQTWDMHSTAKNFVCTIECPDNWVVFSLVGCIGMMGVNKNNIFIGVNNINTSDGQSGIIWPAFIRAALYDKSTNNVLKMARNIPFTSGHNYLISDGESFENWEISSSEMESPSQILPKEKGIIFHTNHCLSPKLQKVEEETSLNSTTHERYHILEKVKDDIKTTQELIDLLKSHENYPKSICGHFESGVHDPSQTCGGGVYDFDKKEVIFWRGCSKFDKNYKEIRVKI